MPALITDISIWQMVQDRLPFLEPDEATELIANRSTVELMYELNGCFGIEEANVGNTDFYNMMQKSLLGDLVAMKFLRRKFSESGSVSSSSSVGNIFLKKAKAGSAEVEYDQGESTSSSSSGSSSGLTIKVVYDELFADAKRKLVNMGCPLTVLCPLEGTDALVDDSTVKALPFILSSGNCGC